LRFIWYLLTVDTTLEGTDPKMPIGNFPNSKEFRTNTPPEWLKDVFGRELRSEAKTPRKISSGTLASRQR